VRNANRESPIALNAQPSTHLVTALPARVVVLGALDDGVAGAEPDHAIEAERLFRMLSQFSMILRIKARLADIHFKAGVLHQGLSPVLM
jgi:hypothetical protein